MKFPENTIEIAALQPDYLGFIFYDLSLRNATEKLPEINPSIKKIGVFVNANYDVILEKSNEFQLDFIQLHGEETPEFCKKLETNSIKVIKSFNIGNNFNFKVLNNYKDCCSHFLFDTKGDYYGGNGKTFDWHLLKNYTLEKTFFLSGGIGLENLPELKKFLKTDWAKKCIAIDCNSKLEISPGLKSTTKAKLFINTLRN